MSTNFIFTPCEIWVISACLTSVAVSKLGCRELFFEKPRVKVNGEYYRTVLLMEKMLPAIWGMSSDFFIFQQDSAQAQRANDTIALLRRETPGFIGPELWLANSPDLNPVDFRSLGLIQERVYQLTSWRSSSSLCGQSWSRVSLTKLLNSGGQGWEPAFKWRDITSNILLNETLLFLI